MKNIFVATIVAFFGLICVAKSAEISPYVELKMGNSWLDNKNNYGDQTIYGFSVGLDGLFDGKVRSELEYNHFDMGAHGAGSVNIDAISANAYVEPVVIFNNIVPYAMIGIGYGFLNGSAIVPDSFNSSVIYNLGAGVSYTINKNWTADLGYRYTTTEGRSIVGIHHTNDYVSNAIIGGIRYNF